MECPMYVDYTRECINKIGFLPHNTLEYCTAEKHKDRPFFKTINKIGFHCECLERRPACKQFGISDFEKFVEISEKYCLSENNVNCERFKLRKAGKEVPLNLLPDGTKLTEK